MPNQQQPAEACRSHHGNGLRGPEKPDSLIWHRKPHSSGNRWPGLRESSADRKRPVQLAPARRNGSFTATPAQKLATSTPAPTLSPPLSPSTPLYPSLPLYPPRPFLAPSSPQPPQPPSLSLSLPPPNPPTPQKLTPLPHRGVSEQSERAPVGQGRQRPTV